MTTTIRLGSLGDPVKLLQTALNRWLASTQSRLLIDGFFGLRTNRKVREYQLAHQLAPDGVVGPVTWESLRPLVDEPLAAEAPAASAGPASDRVAPASARPRAPHAPAAERTRAAFRSWTATPSARRDATARIARRA